MTTSEIESTRPTPPAAAHTAAVPVHGFGFHDFLSAINPLQYLPVVGTIYRAVTGDVIPEALREAGSLLVSGLLGGPIGLLTNIVATLAEKITGIDPEKIAVAEFHPVPPPVAAPVQPPVAKAIVPIQIATTDPAKAPAQLALTQQQLAAYGVRSDTSGTLKLGNLEGADVLNTLQLVRLGKAAAAYAANQPRTFSTAASGG